MNLYALLFDIAALAIVVLCALYYAHKGFLAGLLSFFGTLAAMALAGALAWWLAPTVFDHFLRPGLEDSMAAAIAEGGFTSTRDFLDSILGFLPEDLIQTIYSSLQVNLDFTAPDIARHAVQQVVQPLVVPLVTLLLFFALFVVMRLLLWVVRKATSVLTRLPVISTLNGFLGLIMGVLVGLLYLVLILLGVFAYNAFNPSQALVEGHLDGSVALGLFSWLDFFAH